MFDTLTKDELYALHTKLYREAGALHRRLMDGDKALIPPLSEEWNLLSAKGAEISETMNTVYEEIDRREQEEPAGTRALRDLRIQRGIDA